MLDEDLYSMKEAAEYLDVFKTTFRNMVVAEKLKPDLILAGRRYFSKETLNKWKDAPGLTVNEIAKKYGVSRREVFYQFRNKRIIHPDTIRKHDRFIFALDMVERMAELIGWKIA